ncbi:hypothetical protein DQ04_02261060 [Trypanosoma grayi]|uniref:hypothetical protein n=1 Tax=Trypanosoma grayi TaxID=71804 RepID=UPI0004F4A54E|nr:hypothetical protein DQ04_02261060 [Trypanosoma grayi]KEG11807.1 hypothetical protein DQ04_02261060 [Trypanosoma grayi]
MGRTPSMTATRPGICSSDGALVHAAEKRIPDEIRAHFTGMRVFRELRDGTSNSNDYACMLALNRKRRRDFACEGNVHVERCVTRVLSCMSGQVLRGYYVLWAESTISITTSNLSTLHTPRRSRMNGTAAAVTAVAAADAAEEEAETKEEEEHCDARHHVISFLSLHIVDGTAHQHPSRHSFALQSVCQPGRVLQLECYPYHMIHFGLLMHALWRGPNEVFEAVREQKQQVTVACPSQVGPADTCALLRFPLIASATGTAVLILGLGGNVIGNFLDAVLADDVSIDVVELEPVVLETCRQHGQVPPCEVEVDKAGSGAAAAAGTAATRVWGVTHGHPRHPNYRFVVGGAREVLREECSKSSRGGALRGRLYTFVFLDCYDPAREHMMHDGGLIELCRSRLQPGGALIVNAHILPTTENLEGQFLSHGFATVQVLHVAGCDQSIVVCLAGDDASSQGAGADKKLQQNKEEEASVARLNRFCVRHARHMAQHIRDAVRALPNAMQPLRGGFHLDAAWLKSSRSLKSASCPTRLWEHYD